LRRSAWLGPELENQILTGATKPTSALSTYDLATFYRDHCMFQAILKPRVFFFLIALCCGALMGYALFAQHYQGFEPCMLCMVQRVFMSALGITALLAAIHNPKSWGWRVYGLISALWATLGAYIAARHVYLQSLPPGELGCAPSFEYALKNYDSLKFLQTIFIRDQDCGKIDWVFLGLSMPRWVLLWFVVMALAVLWRSFSAKTRR
jgi:protein dithiol:quinone oxidoreductase